MEKQITKMRNYDIHFLDKITLNIYEKKRQ